MKLNRERKIILAVGGVLLALALAYRFAPPLEGVLALGDATSLREEKLASYRRIAKKRAALEAHLNSLQGTLAAAESGLLTGKTAALAAVEVQNIVKQIVTSKGAQVRTMRVLTPEAKGEGAYLGVPVQATIQSNVRQLKDVLHDIENSPTLLNIQEVRVRSVRQRNQEDQLQSTLTVAGFVKQ